MQVTFYKIFNEWLDMFGIIQDWLFSQIGINFYFNSLEENNIFSDGSILVDIFQKYGLLNTNYSLNITKSNDQENCKRNLKLLKPIFDMLNIKYDDKIILDIVSNNHATILKLLYELYVCLENKQSLYFITQQHYEAIQNNIIKCLGNQPISEKTAMSKIVQRTDLKCFEKTLIKNKDIIKWYKNKTQEVTNNLTIRITKIKKEIEELPENRQPFVKRRISHCPCSCDSATADEDATSLPALEMFLKSKNTENLLSYEQYIDSFKVKQRQISEKMCFENNIQNELLNKTWNNIMEKQNEIYNSVFSEIMLKQSQYEKKILAKLIQTQQQEKLQNENQTQTAKKVIEEEENHINCDFQIKEDFEELRNMYENEQKRVLMLHRKLYKEKQDLIQKRHYALCYDVIDSVVDLAVNSSDYKSKYGEPMTKVLWENWKQLFYKSQPIHIPFEHLESEILLGKSVDYDEMIEFEKRLSETLNKNDLDEYYYTCGRWFYEDVCIDHGNLDEKNLAFIINRLLLIKYPPPPPPLPADLPPFSFCGVILNFDKSECVEKLQILLNKQRIHVFDPKTAIQASIDSFVKETQIPKEESFKNKSKPSKGTKKETKKSKLESSAKSKSPKKDKDANKLGLNKTTGRKKGKSHVEENVISSKEEEKVIGLVDKETQTSIAKGDDTVQTIRTALGLIGEEVFTALKSGQKLEDSLIVSVIIEYLKTLSDYNGWILLNYPGTLVQASTVELALSGKSLPLEEYIRPIEEDETIKEAGFDENIESRKSKIFPYSAIKNRDLSFKTHFSVFIKIVQQMGFSTPTTNKHDVVDNIHNIGDFDQEINDENSNMQEQEAMDKVPDILETFYKYQSIYKELELEICDLPALKTLARAILGDDVTETNSMELFGEEALNKLTKSNIKSTTKEKKPGAKDKKNKKGKQKSPEILVSQKELIQDLQPLEEEQNQSLPEEDLLLKIINPNDEKWPFVSLEINHDLAVILATIWENIENCYLDNLSEIFFENRMINLRLVPYSSYIRKAIQEVVRKPDIRQDLVNIYIDYHNSLSHDLRALPDVKNQLFCKVFKMQQSIWQIIDDKKNEVESKRKEIILENWLVTEISMLINNYLSLVQTEFDRSLETLKLVSDYYLSMLGKTPSNYLRKTKNETMVTKVTTDDVLYMSYNILSERKTSKDIPLLSPSTSTIYAKDNFIAYSLTECTEKEKYLDLINVIFPREVKITAEKFLSLSSNFYFQIKSETDIVISANKKAGKEKITTKLTTKPPDTKSEKLKNRVSSTKKSSLKNSYEIHEVASHKKELIEKQKNLAGRSIEVDISDKELLLKEWKLTVDAEIQRFNFRMELITAKAQEDIMEFYCYIESVFCELNQSILSKYNTDIQNTNKLCTYLRTAIEEEFTINNSVVFKEGEFFIEAIDDYNFQTKKFSVKELLEQPRDCYFTIIQLTNLMNIFKIAGPLGVIRKQPFCYILHDLVLFNDKDNQPHFPKMWNLLNEFQLQSVVDNMFGPEFGVNWRDFLIYNLDLPYPKINDILSLRKHFLTQDQENTELISIKCYEETVLWFEREIPATPEESLRIALAKDLLCKMFLVDEDKVNYTAMLLYFCKDFDPSFGLRKALCLSIGKNVITSQEELSEILQNEIETKESVENLLNNIVNTIVYNREGVLIYEVFESTSDLNIGLNVDDSLTNYTVSDISESRTASNTNEEILSKCSSFVTDKKVSISQPLLETYSANRSWVSRVPVAAVLNVLNASFIHQNCAITVQYLRCLEEAADEEGMIEAHNMINLSCIKDLFKLTNKFKVSYPCEILEECLKL